MTATSPYHMLLLLNINIVFIFAFSHSKFRQTLMIDYMQRRINDSFTDISADRHIGSVLRVYIGRIAVHKCFAAALFCECD